MAKAQKGRSMFFVNEKFDIIIQGGQSNAFGMGWGPVEEEYQADEDILYLDAEKITSEGIKDGFWGLVLDYLDKPFEITVANNRMLDGKLVGDFALTFAREYKKKYLAAGRKILIVRAGVGGTGFMKKHWRVGDVVYEKMLELIDYALGLNPENKIVAFLWHQGEHDAFEKNDPDIFKEQLQTMLSSVKQRYHQPDMPFISADFVNEWKTQNLDTCVPIIERIKEVTAWANGEFVETSDLLSNNQKNGCGDVIHFCRNSLQELGYRYFQAYERMNSKNNT